MNRIKIFIILLIVLIFSPSFVLAQNKPLEVYFFYSQTCPYCSRAITFLSSLQSEYPGLVVRDYEVTQNASNAMLFKMMAQAYGRTAENVPAFFIDQEMINGFDDTISAVLENKIQECLQRDCFRPADKFKTEQPENISDQPLTNQTQISDSEEQSQIKDENTGNISNIQPTASDKADLGEIILGFAIIILLIGLMIWGSIKLFKRKKIKN